MADSRTHATAHAPPPTADSSAEARRVRPAWETGSHPCSDQVLPRPRFPCLIASCWDTPIRTCYYTRALPCLPHRNPPFPPPDLRRPRIPTRASIMSLHAFLATIRDDPADFSALKERLPSALDTSATNSWSANDVSAATALSFGDYDHASLTAKQFVIFGVHINSMWPGYPVHNVGCLHAVKHAPRFWPHTWQGSTSSSPPCAAPRRRFMDEVFRQSRFMTYRLSPREEAVPLTDFISPAPAR